MHINPESNQPVIPRHVRDQLEQPEVTVASAAVAERVEPTLSEPAQSEEKGTKELEQASQAQTVQTQVPVENTPVEVEEVKAEENTVSPTVSENSSVELVDTVSAEPEVVSSSEPKVTEGQPKTEPELSLNPNIETAEIAEFEGESNILDVHLHEQQRFDDESALAMAEQIIALNVYPNPRRALSVIKH